MTIKTDISKTDYRAFQRHVAFQYRKLHLIMSVPVILIALSSWFGGKPGEPVGQRVAVLFGSLIYFVVIMVVLFSLLWLIRRVTKSRFAPQLGPHMFEISMDGLIETNEATRVETKVAGIKRIDEKPMHYFVITKAGLGHIIPKRDIANPDELIALKKVVDEIG